MTARELPPIDAKVLPFRRPSAAVRFRRRSRWLTLARPFAQALTLVGVPLALGLWLFSSPTFGLATIEIEGHRYVEPAWVERALAPLAGQNLVLLSLPEVERAVAPNPWIERLTIDKRLPDRLRLVLVERRPAALLRRGGSLIYLDERGREIAPFDPARGPGDLLLVSVATRPAPELGGVFALARELERVAPEWAASLSEVEVLGEHDYRLQLGALGYPLTVRAGTLGARLAELRRLAPELERRYGTLRRVDLRFDRRIVVQPAEPAPLARAATPERVRT